MAQLLLECFDGYSYSDIGEIMRRADASAGGTNSISTSSSPRGSAPYLNISNTGTNALSDIIEFFPQYPAVSGNVCIFGFLWKMTSIGHTTATGNFNPLGTASGSICSMGSISQSPGTIQCWLALNADGTISVMQGIGGTVVGTTSASIAIGIVNYVEVKITVHPSAGTVDIKFNGTSVLSLTGKNTAATGIAGWNSLFLPMMGFGGAAKLLDLYVADGSGATWNDFMGAMRLDLSLPNANGTNNSSTPSTGTDRFATVDENPMDGDSTYNTFANVNDIDTYNFPNAPVTGAAILGIETRSQIRKTDAGAAGVKHAILVNGSTYLGSENGVSTSYSVIRQAWSTNPDTGIAWTDTGTSGFNSAEFGLKKTS